MNKEMEFAKKLEVIRKLAKAQGNTLSQEQVEDIFAEIGITGAQLEPVFAYLMIAMKQYENIGYAGSYNVGPDEESCLTTGDLVNRFCEIWNRQNDAHLSWYHESDGGPHEANFLKLDCAKLKQTFGWSPKWDSHQMLEKTVEWMSVYRKNLDVRVVMEKQIVEYQ